MLDDIMLPDIPLDKREGVLRDNCDKIVERSYTKKFNPQETNERRAELSDVIIQIADLEQALAEIRADYKGRIKPLQERVAKLRNDLKVGGEWVKTDCFLFVDEDTCQVGIYSPDGYMIEQRPMTSEERQRNVFRVLRTGTDN